VVIEGAEGVAMNARPDHPRGIVHGMPAVEYHAIAAMSAGGLKRMAQSPAHFYGQQLDPNRPPHGDGTPYQKAGTLFHCALFEPAAVDERYIVRPAGLDMRTKEGKAWQAALPMDGPPVDIIDAGQLATARNQARNVMALPEVAALMSEGVAESSAFWIDEETGELCKCRPDWTSPAGEGVILVDGKSAKDASPAGFSRAVWNWRYDLQAAWYSDGYERATGTRVHGFVFAAVESDWPNAAAAYMLDDQVLDAARREYRRLLNQYAECKRSGVWPGYPSTIQPITLPAWAMKELEA
jgi:PDDEXK-like domain of unknown function (DUF3799)